MSTHNKCFYGEIRKIIPELLSNTPYQAPCYRLEMKSEKTHLLTIVPNEDSNYSAHPHSLIRVLSSQRHFAYLAIQNAPSKDLDQIMNTQTHLNLHRMHMS